MLREQMGVRKLSDRRTLLPAQLPQDLGKRTLVVDLDETLVHSSFQVHVLTVDRYQNSASACCSCSSIAECAYSDEAHATAICCLLCVSVYERFEYSRCQERSVYCH
jgi:hypothetical protein